MQNIRSILQEQAGIITDNLISTISLLPQQNKECTEK